MQTKSGLAPVFSGAVWCPPTLPAPATCNLSFLSLLSAHAQYFILSLIHLCILIYSNHFHFHTHEWMNTHILSLSLLSFFFSLTYSFFFFSLSQSHNVSPLFLNHTYINLFSLHFFSYTLKLSKHLVSPSVNLPFSTLSSLIVRVDMPTRAIVSTSFRSRRGGWYPQTLYTTLNVISKPQTGDNPG